MSKRNVAFVRPQDPSFLRRLKEQIGYKEGPTVDTKRQRLENLSDSGSDSEEQAVVRRGSDSGAEGIDGSGAAAGQKQLLAKEDEKPQVVVLAEGDLTAEEAEAERARIEKEEREKPADLNQRIIFKARHKPIKDSIDDLVKDGSEEKGEGKKSKKKSKEKKVNNLSFNHDDEEEEDEDN